MDDDTRERLTRVEEAQGFTDRHVDELDEQVREAFERVRKLNVRLDSLEERLRTLAAAGEVAQRPEDEPPDAYLQERPPHSAGPRDD